MEKLKIYNELVKYYLFISQVGLYTKHGHAREATMIKKLIKKHKKTKGKKLLIAASGLGLHDRFLKKDFEIIGIDKNESMLRISRKINPDINYKKGDVKKFKLDEKFDVIMCMDALPHLITYRNLKIALKNLSRHLKKDGLLMFSLNPVKKSFKGISVDKYSRGNLEVTLIQVNHKHSKKDVFDCCFIFVIKEKDKRMKIYLDECSGGLFEVTKIKKILTELGFKSHVYEGYYFKKYRKENPVFVCVR